MKRMQKSLFVHRKWTSSLKILKLRYKMVQSEASLELFTITRSLINSIKNLISRAPKYTVIFASIEGM